jgi:hypothetical protein
MKKTALSVVCIILLFGLVLGSSFSSCIAQRPPFRYFQILVPSWSIAEGATFGIIIDPISPEIYSSNVTLSVSTGTITVLSTKLVGGGAILSVTIDNKGAGGVNIIVSDGQGHSDYASVFFITRPPPNIQVLSPQNMTYKAEGILLNFTLSESTDWIGYSLDRHANVTVTGNTTLPQLTTGLHNITIYANYTYGTTGFSQTVIFTVEKSESFSIEATAAAVLIMVIVVATVGVLLYRRHRKTISQNTPNV